jgi:hypothetical protein
MADIKQAAKWMKDGKEVRRPQFLGGFAYRAARKLSGISNHIETNDNADMTDEPFTLSDLLADDWEIADAR